LSGFAVWVWAVLRMVKARTRRAGANAFFMKKLYLN